jgi:soluble lytic murein transglycosylase-like protein
MKPFQPILLLVLITACPCCASSGRNRSRQQAEYYVAGYAQHYQVPVEFVRAIVEQESAWRPCPTSGKRAMGLMQLMPGTARRLNVHNRCDPSQNVSGGVRYLAWLMSKFHGDLRLVAAAYYAGERTIELRGLKYANSDVVGYVASLRKRFERQRAFRSAESQRTPRRTP